MTLTQSRVIQYIGLILVAGLLAAGYWYFSVRAGVRTNTSLSQPAGIGRLDSGLVGYWRMDDGSGTSATDSSTNADTGTLTNGPTWTTGQIGGAVNFDGSNDYITSAGTTGADIRDSLSLATWVKFDTLPSSGNRAMFIRNDVSGNHLYSFQLYNNSGAYFINFIPGGGGDDNFSSAVSISTGTWYHMVTSYDAQGDDVSFYLNGTQVGTAADTVAGGYTGGAGTLFFGSSAGATSFLDGQMDEVRIYDRPLSSSEVAELYRLTTPTGVDTGLKGYWSFDGGSMATSTIVRDLSGAGNAGTLTNGPAIVAGKVNQGLSFDNSNDYVSVADASALDITAAISMGAWIRTTDTTDNCIISKSSAGPDKCFNSSGTKTYELGIFSNALYFQTSNGTTTNAVSISSTGLTDGVWHHIMATWDGTTTTNAMKIYIDGVVVAQGTATVTSIQNSAAPLNFGGDGGSGDYGGTLDEVRLYNRALSSTEVQALYQLGERDEVSTSASQPQGGGRMDSGLIAYWPLDETTGSTATDSSNGGNNQTLTNMENGDWIAGQIGNSLSFDGAGEYATSSRTIPDRGTLSAWVKSGGSLNTGDNYLALFGGDGSNYLTIYATTFTTTNTYCFAMRGDFGTDVAICGPEFASTADLQGWHHVTATWDATKGATFYIDGAQVAATTTGTNAFVAMTLGLSINDTGQDWFGQLDEVRMYNRIFTADEVSQLSRLTTPTPVETSLKGYWAFSGQDVSGTSIYDMSGTGNTGTLTNGPAATTGIVGQAYDYNGSNQYVSVADSSTLDFTASADFTLSGWFRRDSFATDDTVIAKRNGLANTDDGYICYIDDATDRLTCEMSETGGTDEFQLEANQAFTSADWHHFALVWDDDSNTATDIYIDGVATSATESGSTLASMGDLSNAVTLRFGAESDAGNPFDGKLDEMRVYNRVLTAAEIKSQYEAGQRDLKNSSASQPQGSGRHDSGLVGYWRLDETTGSSASDSSTSGNAGTLFNMENGDWSTGQIGNGLTFDGVNEYMTIPDADNLDFNYNQDFALALWAKLPATQTDTGDVDNALIEKWSNNGEPAAYYLDVNNQTAPVADRGKLSFKRNDGTNSFELQSNRTVNDNLWHHIVGLKRGTQIELYIDGSLDAVGTDNLTTTTTNSVTVCVARRCAPSSSDLMLQGSLDEIRIYNRALSEGEVAQLARIATPTGIDTSLKGYWSFNGQDMVSSTLARDLSGAGYAGTLINSPAKSIGKLGQALNFASASTQYVSLGSSMSDYASKTVCSWVRPSSSLTTYGTIMGRYTLTPTGWQMLLDFTTTSSLRFGWWRSFNGADGYWYGRTTVPYNQWSHVCVSYDESSPSNDPVLYINGVASIVVEDTAPTGSADSLSSQPQAIGVLTDNSSFIDYFDGVIDEVRLYNRILSASEVKALYDASR